MGAAEQLRHPLNPDAAELLAQLQFAIQMSIEANGSPQTHPLWEGIPLEDIPKKVRFSSCSPRKYGLLASQFLHGNEEAIPPMLESYFENNDWLGLLDLLKRLYYNGNGSLQGTRPVGSIGGVTMTMADTTGEQTKNFNPDSRLDAAGAKALDSIERNPPEEGEWTMSVDTMDQVDGQKPLSKAENQFLPWLVWCEATNALERETLEMAHEYHQEITQLRPENLSSDLQLIRTLFIDWYFENFLPEGSTLRGITAIALLDHLGKVRATAVTELSTMITRERIAVAKEHADLQASGMGALQFLMDKEDVTLPVLSTILGVPGLAMAGLVWNVAADREYETELAAV